MKDALLAYCENTSSTAIYPRAGTPEGNEYVGYGLIGEAGEVNEVFKKMLRDDDGEMTDARRDLLIKELGDVFWYWSEFHRNAGFDPESSIDQAFAAMHAHVESADLPKRLAFFAAQAANMPEPEQQQGSLAVVLYFAWQIGQEYGIDLEVVFETNAAKLASRKERGVLQGSGDNR